MLDPWTALSLAGNVVQFVDFSMKVVSGSRAIYKSSTGLSDPNAELDFVAKEMHTITARLRRPLPAVPTQSTAVLPEAVKSEDRALNNDLEQISIECEKISEEIQKRLARLRVDPKNRVWSSVQKAFKTAWSREELENLSDRLSNLSDVLQTRILVSLRESLDLASVTASRRFDILDQQTQYIINSMLASGNKAQVDLKDRLNDQTLALVQIVDRIELAIEKGNLETQHLIASLEAKDPIDSAADRQLAVGLDKAQILYQGRRVTVPEDEASLRSATDQSVLNSLHFQSMQNRYDDVADIYPQTFQWIFSQSTEIKWSNFVAWLGYGNGVYWINGKAGSGKSTLMRHIYESNLTTDFLQPWAGDSPLCISSFFFWRSGTPDQRSLSGLLRALLFNILTQQPKLISQILPWHWAKSYNSHVASSVDILQQSWPLKSLMKAFQLLVQQTLIPMKLLLFIDGLDEFDEMGSSYEAIAMLLKDITRSGNIKVCVSSRPLVMFSNVFDGSPSLRLQDLTFDDIQHYVAQNFGEDPRFQELASREPIATSKLVQEVVEKADEVFLWIVLVVRSLLKGLGYRDGISDLQRRVRILPVDLEQLYRYMMTKIEPFYQESVAEIFQIVRAVRNHRTQIGPSEGSGPPLTNLTLALATNKHIQYLEANTLSSRDIDIMCRDMEIRLRARCAGLLECSGPIPSDPDSRVNYLHATARDFIEGNPESWGNAGMRTGPGFNAHLALLKACVFELELRMTGGCGPAYYIESVRRDLATSAMIYAFHVNKETRDLDWGLISRLKELSLPGPFEESTTFLRRATLYGLFSYVDKELKSQAYSDMVEDPTELLLSCISSSLSQQSRVIGSTIVKVRYPCTADMIAVLLKNGANPNKRLDDDITPWEQALYSSIRRPGNQGDGQHASVEWVSILKCLILAGANPKVMIWMYSNRKSQLISAVQAIADTFRESHPIEAEELIKLLECRGGRYKRRSQWFKQWFVKDRHT